MNPEPVIVEVEVGFQGPKGAPGGTQRFVADAALSGHRAVIRTATGIDYADAAIAAHCGQVIGITTGAVTASEVGEICAGGDIDEPSWDWTPGLAVFLGLNGLLTQTPPTLATAAFSQELGFAVSPTKLFVQLRDPIALI